MSHLQGSSVSINEVYDFAYDIAQEFEKLVFLYGTDKVELVIEKVINVLEILEISILKIEQLGVDLDDLKSNNFHLESEKIISDHEKSKLKKIYEESEESWSVEVVNLKSELSVTKSENESLKNHLAIKTENSSKSEDTSKNVIQDQENTIHKLRCSLKQRDKQIQDHVCSINALNTRVQELLEMNKILHAKNQQAKNEISKLIINKNDYRSELIEQKRENMLLHESIDELVKTRFYTLKGSQQLSGASEQRNENSLPESIDFPKNQEVDLLKKINKLQSELHCARSKLQSEENFSKHSSGEKKATVSKIQQFFRLFLGVTAISEFC